MDNNQKYTDTNKGRKAFEITQSNNNESFYQKPKKYNEPEAERTVLDNYPEKQEQSNVGYYGNSHHSNNHKSNSDKESSNNNKQAKTDNNQNNNNNGGTPNNNHSPSPLKSNNGLNVGSNAQKATESVNGAVEAGEATASAGTSITEGAVTASSSISSVITGFFSTLSGFFLFLVVAFIGIVAVISLIGVFVSSDTINVQSELSNEAEKIICLFTSYTGSSSDDDAVSSYMPKLTKIVENDHAAILCSIWTELIVDTHYYNRGLELSNFDHDIYDTATEQEYHMACLNYYISCDKDDNFEMKQFDAPEEYTKDNYKEHIYHYRFCNNLMRMCIDAFIDPETGEIFADPKSFYQELSAETGYVGESETDIYEECRKYVIKKVISNLEGENGLIKNCIAGYTTDGDALYLNSYLYNKDSNTNEKTSIFKDNKLDNNIVNNIINYDKYFRTSVGTSSEEITTLALSQLGNKGDCYYDGQTKAWGNGGAAHWCSIFCAWLLEQCNETPSKFGWSASCSQWVRDATDLGIYYERTSNYTPKVGDFIFFDYNKSDNILSNHVGIIVGITSSEITTVEGNSGDSSISPYYLGSSVCTHNYLLSEYSIKGYVSASYSEAFKNQAGAIYTNVIDELYKGTVVNLTEQERTIIENLVSNENSINGYEGCILVAQCMRDAIVAGKAKALTMKTDMGYSASTSGTPTQDAVNAVKFIFDEGNYAVQHRILRFYNPSICSSAWHESQKFVIEHGTGQYSMRYFDDW